MYDEVDLTSDVYKYNFIFSYVEIIYAKIIYLKKHTSDINIVSKLFFFIPNARLALNVPVSKFQVPCLLHKRHIYVTLFQLENQENILSVRVIRYTKYMHRNR